MVTTLEKHGDGYALVLDKAVMERLHIHPYTLLKITPNGNSFTVAPAEYANDEEEEALFVHALQETHAEYGRVLKKLAE